MTKNKLKDKINKQIRSTLIVESRYDWSRIDGKKTLSEKITNQTLNLMKDFHLWVSDNFIRGAHFDINGFYVPKQGEFENHTLDELIEKYLREVW